MSRQRRRRINAENEINDLKPEQRTDVFAEEQSDKVTFMEEVNYKMEFKDSARPSELVMLRN
jgi:hypothetical protein